MKSSTKTRNFRGKAPARVYWPGCAVCQYMKKNQDFRYRCMQSTYFNPQGSESLMDVVHAFGDPFKSSAMYQHMKRHQTKDLIKAAESFDENGNGVLNNPAITNTVRMLDRPSEATENHEIGLDEFIQQGRDKMVRGEMQITANTYLQAIKIKADIQKSNKDRKLDAMKALFGGASGRKED